MAIDPVLLVPVLKTLMGAGVNVWNAYKTPGFGDPEQKALKELVDAGLGVAGLFKSDSDGTLAAAHFALVTRSFGEAFQRYWYNDPHFAPKQGIWSYISGDSTSRARAERLEKRLFIAASKLIEPGGGTPEETLEQLSTLIGDPKNTPYYRKLWDAYTNTSLDEPGEQTLISRNDHRKFEGLFDRAYAEGLSSPQGETIRRYVLSLQEDRTRVIKTLLLRDISSWGNRHVFGAVSESSGVPMMPLNRIYVEPLAVRVLSNGQKDLDEASPVLSSLEKLLVEHHVVVLQADFGHGKSLSARSLAQQTAARWLVNGETSPHLRHPIFVKCAEDFESHSDDLEKIIRRAQLRLARSLNIDSDINDPAFALPPKDHHTLIFIDGLDEVALGTQEVEGLFRRIHEQANGHRRFVVFSRPAVLPSVEKLKDTPVLELMPLQRQGKHNSQFDQIEQWLEQWNALNPGRDPLTIQDLEERKLLEIAETPILLFMICHSWEKQVEQEPSLGGIYEAFFQQLARGKHENDCDKHPHVANASRRLLDQLRAQGHVKKDMEPHEAMLWLMSRVAWEAKCIEDAQWLQGEQQSLDTYAVKTILRNELKLTSESGDQIIQVGLLLAMQANLQEGTGRILFGHRSFREYLIARYWMSRLEQSCRRNQWSWAHDGNDPLLKGRLLTEGKESFSFLQDQLKLLSPDERRQIAAWGADCFNDESSLRGAKTYREDTRPLIREAALALSSDIQAVQVSSPTTLRSMLAWFWLHGYSPIVLAPRMSHVKAQLAHSDLQSADLRMADLRDAEVKGADIREAKLDQVVLAGADLHQCRFFSSSLRNADLSKSQIGYCNFLGADLSGADLSSSGGYDTRFMNASLVGANFAGAELLSANFYRAVLRHANLQGADMEQSSFFKADLRGAILRGANLSEVNFREADLSGADLTGAELKDADITIAKNTLEAILDPEVRIAVERTLELRGKSD